MSVTERAREQGRRLRALREHLEISKGRLMDALGLNTTNGYDLYERGASVIRLDRLHEWGAAFGIDGVEFVEYLLGRRPIQDAESWTLRDALRGQVTEDQITEAEVRYGGWLIADQKAAAIAIIDMAAEMRADASEPAKEPRTPSQKRNRTA